MNVIDFCMVVELEIETPDRRKYILLCKGWTTNEGKGTRSC